MLGLLLFITNSKILRKPHKSERSPYCRHRRIQEKLGEYLALSVDQGVETSGQIEEKTKSACNAGYLGSIPGLGRSPEKGNGNPLQYSCLENSMDRGT